MNITEVEFNALVAELGKAMVSIGGPTVQQTEVISILAPLKLNIVAQ